MPGSLFAYEHASRNMWKSRTDKVGGKLSGTRIIKEIAGIGNES